LNVVLVDEPVSPTVLNANESADNCTLELPDLVKVGELRLRKVRLLGNGGEGSAWLYSTEEANPMYAVVKRALKSLMKQTVMTRAVIERCGGIRGQVGELSIDDFDCDDGESSPWGPVAVLPYVDGVPMQRLLEKGAPLERRDSLHLSTHVASRLKEYHRGKVDHRDLKPANIMIMVPREGQPAAGLQVEFIDLSMGRLPWMKDEQVGGTPLYMAPEQWEQLSGGPDAGVEADIYAFRHMLYLLLAGRNLLPNNQSLNQLRELHADCVRGKFDRVLKELGPRLHLLLSSIFSDQEHRAGIEEVNDVLRQLCRLEGVEPDEPFIRGSVNARMPDSIEPDVAVELLRKKAVIVAASVHPVNTPTVRVTAAA